MSPPILFIHYGNTKYLRSTLRAARRFNPDKQVVLLGDERNASLAELGIHHYRFDDYAKGDEIETFDRCYQFVGGEKHGQSKWVNFVFRRWFLIHNFIRQHQIEAFWTFDSDNLILSDLSAQESKFAEYQCTEQCNGTCMNGFVTSTGVVTGYVDKINELFQRQDYIEEQRASVASNPGHAFTEMKAYATYKEESGIITVRLNKIIDGETFDECICQAHDMETYEYELDGQRLKKIFLSDDGHIYTFHLPTQVLVRLNSINLSWVPNELFERLLTHAERKLRFSGSESRRPFPTRQEVQSLDLREGRVARRIRRMRRNIDHLFFDKAKLGGR